MLNLSEFAVRQVFNRAKDGDNGTVVYWREATEFEGYLLVWPDSFNDDGTNLHHHTYKHPIDYTGFVDYPWIY